MKSLTWMYPAYHLCCHLESWAAPQPSEVLPPAIKHRVPGLHSEQWGHGVRLRDDCRGKGLATLQKATQLCSFLSLASYYWTLSRLPNCSTGSQRKDGPSNVLKTTWSPSNTSRGPRGQSWCTLNWNVPSWWTQMPPVRVSAWCFSRWGLTVWCT